MSQQGPAEVVRAYIKAAVFDRDEAACQTLLAKSSGSTGRMNPPPNAHEMTYEYGEVTEENGEWFAPVTVVNPRDPTQPPMTMPFAPVLENGQWRLDMDKMAERMIGGSVSEVMDQMTDAMTELAEGMKHAFEGVGEAMSNAFQASSRIDQSDEAAPDFESDPLPDTSGEVDHGGDDENASVFAQIRSSYEEMLPNFAQQFVASVGKPITIDMDWESLGGDPAAPGQVLNLCLSPILGGIMMAGQDPAYREAMAQQIDWITLRRVRAAADQALRLDAGTLTMAVCVEDGTPAMDAEKAAMIITGMIDKVRGAEAERV